MPAIHSVELITRLQVQILLPWAQDRDLPTRRRNRHRQWRVLQHTCAFAVQ